QRNTEQNPLCPSVPSVVKKTFTTENTEKHGAESSVPLCALCGEEELTTENTNGSFMYNPSSGTYMAEYLLFTGFFGNL
ncbi:MAG TPA: hypothetical protein PKL65_10740, partial [Bacteroidales bacterium]|nr:hypothetical protein [Bacteroidales bacterium]